MVNGEIESNKFKKLRKQAEEKLKKAIRESDQMPDEAALSIKELIHELQVHQIELEMQNKELQQTQKKLKTSKQKYSNLYDFAPVSYLTLDKDAKILKANVTTCEKFGIARDNFVNRSFYDFINEDDRDLLYLHLQKVFDKKGQKSCELRLKIPENNEKSEWFHGLVKSNAFDDLDGNTLCRSVIIDITERKEAQEELRRSRKYKSIVERNTEAMIISRDQDLIYFNQAFTDLTGYAEEELHDIDLENILICPHKEDVESLFQHPSDTKTLRKQMELKQRDGETINIEIESTIIDYLGNEANLIVIRNIDERQAELDEMKKAKEQVDRLGHFITICASCKRIQEKDKEEKSWVEPEVYISERLENVMFSHGICRRCINKLYPEQYDKFEDSDFQ